MSAIPVIFAEGGVRVDGCIHEWAAYSSKQSMNACKNQTSAQSVNGATSQATQAKEAGAAFVVITGGEPLHHNLQPLTDALDHNCGLPLHLETSGVDQLSGRFDWVTLSPKRHRPPQRDMLMRCDELKVVVQDTDDLTFANAMAKDTSTAAQLLVQPVWDSETAQGLAIHHVKQHPDWRLSLQSHKWLAIR